jgi:hypothetical protein
MKKIIVIAAMFITGNVYAACTTLGTNFGLRLPNYGDRGDVWAACVRYDLNLLNSWAVSSTTVSGTYMPLAGGTFTGSVVHPNTSIWTSLGRIGIGTTAPNYAEVITDTYTTRGLVVTESASYAGTNYGLWSAVSGGADNVGLFIETIGTAAKGLHLSGSILAGANKWSIYSEAPANSYFAGNIGIHNTNPQYPLDVSGIIQSTGIINNGNYTSTGTVTATLYNFPGSGIWNASGNVGIGTTVPISPLSILINDALDRSKLLSTRNVSFPTYGWDITSAETTTGNLYFNGVENNIVVSTITFSRTNGNVGIGTTSPASKLDVGGGVAVGATYSGTSVAPADGLIVEGNVGIGTTAPITKLQITSGTITMEGTGSPSLSYALCLSTAGAMGHCTSATAANGACSCVTP